MSIKFNYASIKRHENCLWCPVASALLGNWHKFCLSLPLFFFSLPLIGPYLFIIASSCFLQFLCYFIFILLLINSLCERATLVAPILVPRFTRQATFTDAHTLLLPPFFLIFPTFFLYFVSCNEPFSQANGSQGSKEESWKAVDKVCCTVSLLPLLLLAH